MMQWLQPRHLHFAINLNIRQCVVPAWRSFCTSYVPKPLGDKMLKHASSSSSGLLAERDIWWMNVTSCPFVNMMWSCWQCRTSLWMPCPTPPPSSLIPHSLSSSSLLFANWFPGERVPSGGEAHGGVWRPHWHHSEEEGAYWQQDQRREGEVKPFKFLPSLLNSDVKHAYCHDCWSVSDLWEFELYDGVMV